MGAAAGVSGPAAYRHFANKEELLRAVLEAADDELRATEIREHIGNGHQDHVAVWVDTLRRIRPGLGDAEAHILVQVVIGLMTSVTFLHLDPNQPDQVDGFRHLLVTVARRLLLETAAAELTSAVHR